MKKTVKIIAGIAGTLIVLLVAAMIIVPLVVDPNDYREQIASEVKKHTGRDLKIEGDIELSLFPWLGVELGAMELSNAEGFGPEPFARFEAVDVHIKLLPLLRKEVEMDTIALHGLQLSLGRNARGVSNWDDLVKPAAPAAQAVPEKVPAEPAEAAASPAEAIAALAIGGIRIEQARVVWDDRQTAQRVAVNNLNLISGALRLNQAFPVELDFDVETAQPQLTGHIRFAAQLLLDLATQRYRLDKMELAGKLAGETLPGGRLEANMGADVAADLKLQTLAVKGLTLAALGLELKGDVNGKQIIDAPSFSGRLASNEFVPRDITDTLAITLPEMADPSVLSKAALSLGFSADLNQAAINSLKLQLDQSIISGKASVKNFTKPAIRYDLTLDEIDADRYLPPPSEKKETAAAAKTTPGTATTGGAAQLPLEMLRGLDIDGTARINKLKIMNLRSRDVHATLVAKNGLLRLHPLGAKLYQGGYQGDLSLDVRKDTPLLGMDEKLAGVQAGPLLKDFMGKDYVTGQANFTAKMTARGIDPMAIRKSLNGNAAFSFADGAVNGVNIAQLLRNAMAAYQKKPAPKDEVKQTDFALLRGSVTVKNGLVTNKDLEAKSPLLRVDGKGTAHLVTEKLDYLVKAAVVGSLEGQGGKELEDLKGLTVPIRITGSFSDPKFNVELAALLDAKAKAELEKKKKEVEQKARKQLKKEQKKLEKDLQEQLLNGLKF